jgi:hypothetical protein
MSRGERSPESDGERGLQFKGRHLPLIVGGIVIPIVAAFYVGGPGLGTAAGAAMAVGILVYAIRQKPIENVEVAPLRNLKRHVLVVISVPLTAAPAVDEVVREAAGNGDAPETEVRVLAPASARFLDRWASDVRPAREAAQQRLVVTVASLAKAGIDAVARVGDESLVQATEDELRSYPATEVILVTGSPETDEAGDRAVSDLEGRLRVPLRRVIDTGPDEG